VMTKSDESPYGETEGRGTSLALVPGLGHAPTAPPSCNALLLRPVEAARLLGIGRSKVFEMLARNELPVIRLGRCVRIPRQGIEDWVDERLAAEFAAREGFLGAGARIAR
jgi:excisionase family DNA binding protein